MGRNKRRGGKGGGRGGGDRDRKPRDDAGSNGKYGTYSSIRKECERLERYYNTLLALPEEEQTQFWEAYKRELPNSFRFCGSKGHASEVMKLLQTRYIPEITEMAYHEGQLVDPPKPVSWFPDQLAWWMTTPKNVVRKFPPFAKFQKFLVSETSVGNISRQEVVSMIPPLVLDIKPGMAVLDMCAAPGSKSAQLLEMIHSGEEARIAKFMEKFTRGEGADAPDDGSETGDVEVDSGDDGRATGLLIANDSEYKRCHMLVHQLKRLSSPNLIVTNHDATIYPAIRIPSADPKKGSYLKFDRILADVPCSGDGTLRKNVNLWKEWQPGSALGLHGTQVRILIRALQLLKVGGKVVYSTCSMNPVENESVITTAIERCGGLDYVDILDSSDMLPGLKRVPGLKDWKVMDKATRIWNNWEEVEDKLEVTDGRTAPGRLARTMFPTKNNLPLERCMRVYPHLQDTGGFFIVVLQKKAEVRVRPENEGATPKSEPVSTANGANSANGLATKRARDDDDIDEQTASKKAKSETDDQPPSVPAAEPKDVDMVDESKVQPEESETSDKVKEELKEEAAAEAKAKTSTETTSELPPAKKKTEGPYEEPFKFLANDHQVIQKVKEFYNLSPRFPSDRYMVRNAMGEPAKAIYYTSGLVRDILVANEGHGIRFVHGGVKMFMKQDAPSAEVCGWRIQSEGMRILQGYVGPERVLYLRSKETLHRLLVEMFPKLADGGWELLGEVGKPALEMGMGCCVLRVEPDPGHEGMERMSLPLWKSFHSLNLMLPKEDRSAMLLRIFNESSVLLNLGLARDKPEAKAEGESEGKAGEVEDKASDGEAKAAEVEGAPVEAQEPVGETVKENMEPDA